MSTLPADSHVHSEWSWDSGSDPASAGQMVRICERAVRIGLPALVFTEHLDLESAWRVDDGDIGEHAQKYVDDTGHVRLPVFDADGYLAAIDRCRHDYPELRILTGVEFGQPHLWDAAAAALLSSGAIYRVNGSLHMLPFDNGDRSEPTTLYRYRPAGEVMWAYLEEIPRMVAGSDSFEVFTHIDYAVRSWPVAQAGPFDPRVFEEGFRVAMRAIADSGRALEMNTRRLWPWIPQWWAEEGGRAVSFGSDTHGPESLAANFPEAMAMVESFGFGPGHRAEDFWTRGATMCYMEKVTHREMRNRSGEILRRVEAGESIEISNNGRPAALIIPVGGDMLDGLIARGEARPARLGAETLLGIKRMVSKMPTAKLIEDSRGRW